MALPTKTKLRLVGALLSAIFGTVVYHEGTGISKDGYAYPYKDPVGIWTVCSGDTEAVVAGVRETPAQCKARLEKSVLKHAQALERLPADAPDYVYLAGIDFAYHVGVYGAKNSTAFKLVAQREYAKAGEALLQWRYVTDNSKRGKQGWQSIGGQWKYDCSTVGNTVCAGIWKRRMWERDTMSGKLGTAEQAQKQLQRYDRMYVKDGAWVIPEK